MANIILENVSLEYPIYSDVNRSLKHSVLKTIVGGSISKKNGNFNVSALKNINLELKHGDRLGISGLNGSGKTTLLRVLSGILYPTSGNVKIYGEIIPFIDLHYGMNPEASGIENVKIRCILLGLDFNKIDKIIKQVIEFSELDKYIYIPVKTYSSGMIMRLSFSIMAMIKSDIIVMDEWLSVGDANFVEKANNKLKEMIDDASILVIASHSPEFLNTICNKRINLKDGEINEQS